MPVVGTFHGHYWRARANTPAAPAPQSSIGYPTWQSSIVCSVVLGVPLDPLRAWWKRLQFLWYWLRRLVALAPEDLAVVDRVLEVLEGPYWQEVQGRVRTCATTPKFHDPKHWIPFSRELRANAGQAQNLYRHLRIVTELRTAYPAMGNPEAHLLAELGYQRMALQGRPRRVMAHPVLHRVH